MNKRVPEIRLKAAFVAVAAPLLTAGCLGATYGTGVPISQQTVQDISEMIAIGGPDKGNEEIVYRPRGGKVVVPPTDALPQPRSTRVAATAGGEWPNDPDVAAKRAQAGLTPAKAPILTNAELAAAGPPAPPRSTLPPGIAPPGVDPAGYQAGIAAMAAAKAQSGGTVEADGTPTRKFLTEPPTEYRLPAKPKPAVVAQAPAAPEKAPEQAPPQGILANLWPWGKPAQ
ncbi:MAG: hypothetical protein U1E56_06135 [Bauldia sp.]